MYLTQCCTCNQSIMISVMAFLAFQAVFLADFKQIKKIQCLSQSDGKALINLEIEGVRQVSITTALQYLLFSNTAHC